MESHGIVRKPDKLGRIVIPKELRKSLRMEQAPLEIISDGEQIILRRYGQHCVFCGREENTTEHMGKWLCAECRTVIGKA